MNPEPLLPFSGRSPIARHASFSGAVQASPTLSTKKRRYLDLLATHGPLTDQDAAAKLSMQLCAVNSTRNALVDEGLVEAADVVKTAFGTTRTRWTITAR